MERDEFVLRPKRQKGEDGYRVFSVRLRERTVHRLENLASQSGRSRNEVIGLLLDYALDRSVIEKEDGNSQI